MKCPFCENDILDEVEKCPICGSKISIGLKNKDKDDGNSLKKEFEETVNVLKEETGRKNKRRWIIVCVIIAIIVAAYGYSKYVDISTTNNLQNIMQASRPSDHLENTYYKVFNKVFGNCTWELENKEYYRFTGTSMYNGLEAYFTIKFNLKTESEKEFFVPCYILMNAEGVYSAGIDNQVEIDKAIDYIFDNADNQQLDWWDFFDHEEIKNSEGDDDSNYDESVYDEDTELFDDSEVTDSYSSDYILEENDRQIELVLTSTGNRMGDFELYVNYYDEDGNVVNNEYSGIYSEGTSGEGVLELADDDQTIDYYYDNTTDPTSIVMYINGEELRLENADEF